MERVEINTLILPDRTLGFGSYKGFNFCTLELPWRFNQTNKSCIPGGTYEATKLDHFRFGKCFYIPDVPDRTEIFIHAGNFTRDIEGCILIGNGIKDIDNDGKLDVVNSRLCIQRLWSMLPEDRFLVSIRRN